MTNTGRVTYDFSGAVVLVTGGGSGIGLEVATEFAAAGATVVIAGRSQERLDSAVASAIGSVSAVAADMGDKAQVDALVKGILATHGHLDVVVSNAASYVPGDIADVSLADWERLRQTNIDGFFYLAQAALPALAESQGTLIATSSVSGLRGDWGQAIYNASKGAVSLFVQSLALDWGPRGVRINAIAPSVTNTEPVAMITGDPALRAHFESRVALGRVAEVDDIAPVVLFLASDGARYVNGVILPVDGGTSASTGQARPPQG